MDTIGDKIIGIYKNYIAPSKEKTGRKEARLLRSKEYDAELRRQGYAKLNPIRRREIANESPLFQKANHKKSLDTFRNWFSIETADGRGAPIKADMIAFRKFEKKTLIKQKFTEARIASRIYGDGFILITFSGDKAALSSPPPDNAEPVRLDVLNSEYINDVAENDNYIYMKHGNKKEINPERIIHIANDKNPGFKLGISTIDILRWTMFSKKNIDIAAGHILAWFSHGIIDAKIENMTKEEQKAMEQICNTHPGAYIHDQDIEVDVKNPTSIDPKPFYDYVILNIAAGFNMPTHILTGIQTGRVTGSEVGFGDYYRDIHDEQEYMHTPKVERLYERILRARGRKWKYEIKWNPIYIDEQSEADIMKARIECAEKAYNGTKGAGGFIDQEEARQIFNNGQIEIDTEKKIKPRTPPINPEPSIPNPQPVKPQTPPTMKPKKENLEMIARWKAQKKKELDELEEKVDNGTASDGTERSDTES